VLCIHFLGLLLVLFYFSAYKFNNKDYCESYSEIVYHAEKDFSFITEYSLQTEYINYLLEVTYEYKEIHNDVEVKPSIFVQSLSFHPTVYSFSFMNCK